MKNRLIIIIAVITALFLIGMYKGASCGKKELIREEHGNFIYTYYVHGTMGYAGLRQKVVTNGILRVFYNGYDTTYVILDEFGKIPSSEKISRGQIWDDEEKRDIIERF